MPVEKQEGCFTALLNPIPEKTALRLCHTPSQKLSPGCTAPHSCCGLSVTGREWEECGCCALCLCKDKAVSTEVWDQRKGAQALECSRTDQQAGERRLVTELEVAGHTGRARLRVPGRCENLDVRRHMELSYGISSSKWAPEGKL